MKQASDLRIPFTWENRHPILLDRYLYIPGCFERHEEWNRIPWEDLFGNQHPMVVEYCSGNGQWICDLAKNNPNRNWIAVEKRFDRSRKIWLRLHRENISNLIVVCGEAVTFTRHYLPPKSVAEIFVNFPDPWPKLRHAKHRLIRKEFIELVETVLESQGKATFTTDDRPYVDQMLEVVFSHPRWKPSYPEPYFTTEIPNFGSSYFCDLWKKKGRTIHHLQFEVKP